MHVINPEAYAMLLQRKVVDIESRLKLLQLPEALPKLAVYASEPAYYRMRAEFRVWHEEDDMFYVMFPPGKKHHPIKVQQFLPAAQSINCLMQPLLDAIKLQPLLRERLFQVDCLTSLRGDTLVTLLYHKPLDDQWENLAMVLQQQFNIDIIGRSRKQKRVLKRDFIMETLVVEGRQYHYQQLENTFTQPNALVNQKMLAWVCAIATELGQGEQPDLLELYCGNGNFTLPLSHHFNKILATEIAKASVNSAQLNLAENDIDNVTVVRLSSEDMTQAMNQVRPFRRLQGIDLKSFRFGSVLVDPPRSGLDIKTLQLVKQFHNILYVSCNLATLLPNLEYLGLSHSIERLAFFDQFPYTSHVECGVWLQRRS